MNDTRKQAADGNGITLREFIDREIHSLDVLLNERAKHHKDEHAIHLDAHEKEHAGTQQAIKVATDALNNRLESMDREVTLKLDTLTEAVRNLVLERASTKGYIMGMGAIIGAIVLIANFAAGLIK